MCAEINSVLLNSLAFKARLLLEREAVEPLSLKSLCFCVEKYLRIMTIIENLIFVSGPYSTFKISRGGL